MNTNTHAKEVRAPSIHSNRKERMNAFAATLAAKKDPLRRYLIGWTKDEMKDREQGVSRIVALHRAPAARPRVHRYLLQNEQGEVLMLHEHPKASYFTREEVTTILIAFWNAGSKAWNAPGLDFFPIVLEDLTK